jgi:dihydrofolate synthase/folylpolyglutamate synthase
VLAQTWREHFPSEKAALVFGVLNDKTVADIYRPLSYIANSIFLPRFRGERAMPPDELAEILASISPKKHIVTSDSCAAALHAARATQHRVLVAGSLHLAGEVLALLRGEPAAFEECAQ